MSLLGIIGFIFVLGTAVLVHEIGHFVTARKFGVLCHEFAIGMGPVIFKKRKGETLYTIRLLPLGGFVSMGQEEMEKDIIKVGTAISFDCDEQGAVTEIYLDETIGEQSGTLVSNTEEVSRLLKLIVKVDGIEKTLDVSPTLIYADGKQMQQMTPLERRLESQPKIPRLIILSAGAIMNFLLALFFIVIVSAVQGEIVGMTNTIGQVMSDSPALNAGLDRGDTIVSVGDVPIENAQDIVDSIQGQSLVAVEILRNGERVTVYVEPEHNEALNQYMIGIFFEPEIERSVVATARATQYHYGQGVHMILGTLGMLARGEAGVNDLSGPVGIAHMTSDVVTGGILHLLIFASIININVGIFNLLPFPALDGGRIFFILVEAIIRRPVSPKFENIVHVTGFVLFMALFVFTFFNDIFRLYFQDS